MKNQTLITFLLLSMVATLSSCEAIGSIFKAGMSFGIILVVIVVGLIIWFISKMGRNK